MTPLVWLAVAVAAGVAAYLVGWPAWRSYRARESRDLNTEQFIQADLGRPRRILGIATQGRGDFAQVGALLCSHTPEGN